MPEQLFAFLDSSDLIGQDDQIRDRARAQGYMFFRGLVPKEAVQSVREGVLEACQEEGWLAPGTNVGEGIAAEGLRIVEGQPEFFNVYDRIQKLQSFHQLPLHPNIVKVYRAIFQEEVLVHSRNICRVFFPDTQEYSTPAHQDFIQIGGTHETWTTWIPLGDCPTQLGGLAIMAGSHREPVLEHHPHIGVGGKGVNTAELPYQWVVGDMSCGDVLMFHSHTIHRALPNLTMNELRLSMDCRYQPVSHPVRADSLEPHFGRLHWDDIYEEWDDQESQFYWKRQTVNVISP